MSKLINLFKKLFSRYAGYKVEKDYIIKRDSYSIILSPRIYQEIMDNECTLRVTKVKGKVATVSLVKYACGKTFYMGTIKKMFKIKGFKDGNCTNFSESNLIYKEGK